MLQFTDYTTLAIPLVIIVTLIIWSLWKKEKWIASSLLAFSLSSGALIFLFVRENATRHENFEVGFAIGMYASSFLTIPITGLGWYLGKKFTTRFALITAITIFFFNFIVAYTYQYIVKKNAEALNIKIVFDCKKLPYHCAIQNNQLKEIAVLKRNGANIEARDFLSRPPLWYAIDNIEAVKLLLENGANPDSFNVNSETPLAYVTVLSLKPNFQIAQLLLNHGALINRTIGFRKKISILNFAIVNQNIEAINFALENGADPTFRDGYKKSPCERLVKMPKEQFERYKKYCLN